MHKKKASHKFNLLKYYQQINYQMANTFISIETFEEIISSYTASLKSDQRNICLISQDMYEDIKKTLLGELVQDTVFRKWARLHFFYITVGADHIVHVKLNNRKENAKNNINKNIHSLPVLIKENMYTVFCSAHLDVSHKKLAGTYDKLRSEWGNINRNLVKRFCERCSICAVRVNRQFGGEVAGKAIIAKNFLSRLQV
jgi:hypothetical protein